MVSSVAAGHGANGSNGRFADPLLSATAVVKEADSSIHTKCKRCTEFGRRKDWQASAAHTGAFLALATSEVGARVLSTRARKRAANLAGHESIHGEFLHHGPHLIPSRFERQCGRFHIDP